MNKRKFEGWYFKHQLGDNMVSLIPGKSGSGAFIQVLMSDKARYFQMPYLSVKNDEIHIGNCFFSSHGCRISLPDIHGEIKYGSITPLNSDIMGPFRFMPMECRHGIISMGHSLSGTLTIEGTDYNFDGGNGYIEKDSGISFPVSYQWLQCNDFPEPCSVMVSIARVPFCGLHFKGCICSIIYRGREYRLATYNGVQVISADETHICLSQKNIQFIIDIFPSEPGHLLKSPVRGFMTGIIRERANADVHIRLYENKRSIIDLKSPHAAYEYVRKKIGG